MTGERAVVGKDNFVAHRAVVPDMTVSQKISAATDPRFTLTCGATINGNEFAKRVFVANLEECGLTLVFQILRLLPNRAIGIKFVSYTSSHRSRQRDMM